MTKRLKIEKQDRKWFLIVDGAPVANLDGRLTYKGRPNYVEGLSPHNFETKGRALDMAHTIGRYVLGLGDFVYSYVEGA